MPGLNQYWHPWLLGGRASGTAVVDGETWRFDGAQVDGEKNWGREGFPEAWWWGQAQGFDELGACVAFAGGIVTAPLDDAFVLPVPLPSEHRNTPGDLEHLAGELRVRVRRFGRHVWSARTSLAALEHGGLERARAELRRRGLDAELESAGPVRSSEAAG